MSITVDLTLEQIAAAIRQLSTDERLTLFRLVTNQAIDEENAEPRVSSEVSEGTFDSMKTRAELDRQLAIAAEALLDDYTNDKELTAFTALDAEDFYAEK